MSKTQKDKKDDIVAEMAEVCSVRVGDHIYGIPIRHVVEIVGAALPQRVPLAPGFVGGLIHYRGDVLTTISIRRLLNMSDHDGAQDVLVLESAGCTFGVLVDGVIEVMTVSSADYEATPCTLEESRRTLFAGAYKLRDGLIVMLLPEQLDPMRLPRAAGALA